MLKADLHIHTLYSMDCCLSLEQIIHRCLKIGINCVAVADHGTIAGALKLKEIAPFPVIVAEEILTPFGEIMGLFLIREIPSPLSVEEAIANIKSQGGLVTIPHPFRWPALKDRLPENLLPYIDIIEVFNSRSLFLSSSTRAQQFAQKHGLPASAGSDAHTASEIGNAYVKMPEFQGKEDFLESLSRGRIVGHRSTPIVHFVGIWSRLKKYYSKGKGNC